MSASKWKEASEGSQPRTSHSPSQHKQPPIATRQPGKPVADAKPESRDRNIETESNERIPTDEQRPLDQKPAVPETFHSHVVSEGARALDYQRPIYFRQRRYPVLHRASMWHPTANQAKPQLQELSGQGAGSQADYIVPNYVRAPEVPPESRCISVQTALIGALTLLIIVAIIAWTLVTLRQTDVLKEPAGQHETGHGQTHGWVISQSDPMHFRSSTGTAEFSGNATSPSEESTVSDATDAETPVVTKKDIV